MTFQSQLKAKQFNCQHIFSALLWYLFLLIPVALLIFSSVSQASVPLLLTDQTGKADPASYLEILEDPGGTLRIDQLATPEYTKKFTPLVSSRIGFTFSVHWLRLNINNQATYPKKWYLVFHGPNTNRFKVYKASPDMRNAPDRLPPVSERTITAYALDIPAQKSQSIYVRLENKNDAISLKPEILSAQQFTTALNENTLLFGLIVGSLSSLAIYNFMLFLTLREKSFLALVLFISSVEIALLNMNGVLNYELSVKIASVCNFVILASVTSFIYQVLRVAQHIPKLGEWYRRFFWLNVLLGVLSPWLSLTNPTAGALGLCLLFLVVSAVVILYRRGDRLAKRLVVAVVIISIPTLPMIVGILGLIETKLIFKLFYLGVFGFLIFLSWMLAERTRELREQKERSEAVNKTKDEFLTTMSHELRTPMNAVINTSTLLKTTRLDEQQQNYITILDTSSRHMLSLIDDVLDLGRIGHQKLELKTKTFSLTGILDKIRRILEEQVKDKKIQLIIDDQFSSGKKLLLGDEVALKQVLLNLLHNAIKFTPEGRVKLVITPLQHTDDSVRLYFRVDDTGIGIKPEHQAQLFKRFSQVDKTTSRKYGGSGLGLAISYELVKLMGGTLAVESEYNKGSCFFFTLNLPLQEEHPEPAGNTDDSAAALPLPSLAGMRVLLVDDDEVNRFLTHRLLLKLGLEVSQADCGEDAIRQVGANTFDLVLMDISMPEMDGYETTRQIRSDPHFASLPIIALTAHAIIGERERCLAAGMDDYLSKPFRLEHLRQVIQPYLKARKPDTSIVSGLR